MLYFGEGVEQDLEEAFKWLKLAAEKGNLSAQVNVGFMLQHGEGVEVDIEEAKKWYAAAAGQNYKEALGYLKKLQVLR